ncbi:MAG: DUF2341 domain-containing protein, partial [Promethearchaeota archaeon]
MKIYRKKLRCKIKSLTILLIFLIIPAILSTPLFRFQNAQINEENEEIGTPKLNAPSNAHYFSFYKDITIDHNKVAGTGTYTDFPVLISIKDTDLRSKTQPDGDDIAFSSENIWLDHEIELFDQTYNGTHAQLIAWVRIPILYGSFNTIIRMYYGNFTMSSSENPGGLWSNNYRGVWHLSESSGNTIDSTSYGTSGIVSGTVSRGLTGKIDGVYDFGTVGQINFGDPADGHLDFGTGSFTISFWINFDDSTSNYQLPLYKGATTSSEVGYDFETDPSATVLSFRISDGSNVIDSPYLDIDIDSWMYVTGVVDRALNRIRIFKNGLQVGSGSSIVGIGNINNNRPLLTPHAVYELNGMMDEIRICSIQRSAGWINTEFSNQNDPDSFYLVGSEQIVASEPPNAHFFTYYKLILIDHNMVSGTGSHINFPVLISLIDENLRYHAQPDGDDIAFSFGGDWLSHEIELFNQSYTTTHAQLIVWVQVPFLSTSVNTIITMYYGNSTMSSRENPSGVWSSNYVNVLHLNEDPSGTVFDSTSYSNDGISLGSMNSLDLISSKIGKGFELDGIDDIISVSESASLDSTSDESTLSIWLKWVDPTAGRYQRIMTTSNRFLANPTPPPTVIQSDGFEWAVQPDGDHFFYPWGGNSLDYNLAINPFANSYWHYVVLTLKYSTRTVELYLNGTSLSLFTENVPTYWTQLANLDDWLWGGNNIASGSQFQGIFDEIRVSNIERSSDWILTEFNNQNDPTSFYTIGSEQHVLANPVNTKFFNYYKVITIDHTKINGIGSHINFPLLISLLDEDLHYDVQNDGDDIAFA